MLKHLKTLRHVSIIIQTIFRELVGSLLKSLNLNFFFKCVSSTVVMRQHNVWCVCVACWQHATHTHQTLCCRITTVELTHFKKKF